jgi:hypothetical protein
MNFIEGMEVVYMNMSGLIDFIGQNYIVVKVPSSQCPARLLVYRENYKDIEVIGK